MIRAFIVLILVALFIGPAQAEELRSLPGPFKGYKKVNIREGFSWGPTVLIDPKLTFKSILLKRAPDAEGDFSYDDSYLELQCSKTTLHVGFSNGPSEDPTFILKATAGVKKQTITVDGTFLAISSGCSVYIYGNSNQFYNVKRKFSITSKGIKEITQPFYLVDMVCEASDTVDLRTEKCGKGESIAKIPKGDKVQILLAERYYQVNNEGTQIPACNGANPTNPSGFGLENYLVRTGFGLVGWVANSPGLIGGTPGTPLSCIIMHGD